MPQVTLRPVESDDYDYLFDPTSEPDMTLWVGEAHDRGTFGLAMDRLRRDKSVVLRSVTVDESVVGAIVATDTGHVPQISVWIDPARRNQGLATSAMLTFTAMMKRRPLQARLVSGNLAAKRVLEKAGFAQIECTSGSVVADPSGQNLIFELGFFPAATYIGTPLS